MRLAFALLMSASLSTAALAQSVFDEPAGENEIPFATSLDEDQAQADAAAQRTAYADAMKVYFLQTIDDLKERVDTLEDELQYMGNVVQQQQQQIATYQEAVEQRDTQGAEREAAAGAAANAPEVAAVIAPDVTTAPVRPAPTAAEPAGSPGDEAAPTPTPAE